MLYIILSIILYHKVFFALFIELKHTELVMSFQLSDLLPMKVWLFSMCTHTKIISNEFLLNSVFIVAVYQKSLSTLTC